MLPKRVSAREHHLAHRSFPGETPVVARERDQSTIVLVIGAGANTWVWKKILLLLREQGHDIYAASVTEVPNRLHGAAPSIDLDGSVSDVIEFLEREDLTGVTLVGSRVGGWVITEIAERTPERLKTLIYLEGEQPRQGTGSGDCAGHEQRAISGADWNGIEVVRTSVEGFVRGLTLDPEDQEWLLMSPAQPSLVLDEKTFDRVEPGPESCPLPIPLRQDGTGTAA